MELSKAVADDFRRGKNVPRYTYEAFIQRVRSIPSSVDFSKLAKNCRPVTDPKGVDTSNIGEGAKEDKITKCPSILKMKPDPKVAERYKTWKVSQLKDACEKHGLPKTGAKAVLIDRVSSPMSCRTAGVRQVNSWFFALSASRASPPDRMVTT